MVKFRKMGVTGWYNRTRQNFSREQEGIQNVLHLTEFHLHIYSMKRYRKPKHTAIRLAESFFGYNSRT